MIIFSVLVDNRIQIHYNRLQNTKTFSVIAGFVIESKTKFFSFKKFCVQRENNLFVLSYVGEIFLKPARRLTISPTAINAWPNNFQFGKWLHWLGHAGPGLFLSPIFFSALSDDIRNTILWFSERRTFTAKRKNEQFLWKTHFGITTTQLDSAPIRLVIVISSFIVGAVLVAAVRNPTHVFPALRNFSALLNSRSIGSMIPGVMIGGVYTGITGQQLSSLVIKCWFKLRSGLPWAVLRQLTRQQEEDYCKKLSLRIYSYSWLNRLLIRFASASTHLPAKAWIVVKEESGSKSCDIARKSRTYKTSWAIIGLCLGSFLGFFVGGGWGSVFFGAMGYWLGEKIGSSFFSYFDLTGFINNQTKLQSSETPLSKTCVEKQLYEQIEYIKYRLLTQNWLSYYWKSYYKDLLSSWGHLAFFYGLGLAVAELGYYLFRLPITMYENGSLWKMRWLQDFSALHKDIQTDWHQVSTYRQFLLLSVKWLALLPLRITLLILIHFFRTLLFFNLLSATAYYKNKTALVEQKKFLEKLLDEYAHQDTPLHALPDETGKVLYALNQSKIWKPCCGLAWKPVKTSTFSVIDASALSPKSPAMLPL